VPSVTKKCLIEFLRSWWFLICLRNLSPFMELNIYYHDQNNCLLCLTLSQIQPIHPPLSLTATLYSILLWYYLCKSWVIKMYIFLFFNTLSMLHISNICSSYTWGHFIRFDEQLFTQQGTSFSPCTDFVQEISVGSPQVCVCLNVCESVPFMSSLHKYVTASV
jgi:hypothetical protein